MLKRIAPILLVAVMLLAAGAGVLLYSTPTQAAPAAAVAAAPPAAIASTSSITEGAYIVQLALGCGCHFNGPLGGLAGGEDFSDPSYGTLHARNITPDLLNGIGNYSRAELETVLRTGRRPNNEQLFPVMPYKLFSRIAEDDMEDLIDFLLEGQTPISNTVTPRALLFTPPPFTPTVVPSATAPISGVARGAYIVNVLGDCIGCHGPDLAGTPGFAPNITSDPTYGIGSLSAAQIANMLDIGTRPNITGNLRFDGSPIGNIMALLISTATTNWTSNDQMAVAEYLKTVTPVSNQAPLFMGPPVVSATVGSSYIYTVEVADIDVFDEITVTASTLPTWLTLGPTNTAQRPVVGSAVLSGNPTIANIGPNQVVLVLTDAAGIQTTNAFTITVAADPTALDPTDQPAQGSERMLLPMLGTD